MAGVFVDAIADGAYIGLNPFTLVTKAKPKHRAERGRPLSIAECSPEPSAKLVRHQLTTNPLTDATAEHPAV
jgi:hypothetical protein